MKDLKQETVEFLLSHKGFRKIEESMDIITISFEKKIIYEIGDLGWSAYDVISEETHYGLNIQKDRMIELIDQA